MPPLVIEKQGSFFIGGRNVHSETLSTLPNYAPVGTITVDQMYVHYQIPATVTGHPITLIHGCCLSGKTWETTPDGRMGWDEYFVRRGRPTYVIDQAGRGRSAVNSSAISGAKLGKATAGDLPTVFQPGREAAWTIFRFGPEYPKPFSGMQFPLDAQDELWKQMVPDWSASLPTPNPTVPALSELAARLDGTVLVSHSQSGIYPFQTAALSAKGVAGIVAIEPGGCPDASGDLQPYRKMPILVLFGDYVDQSTRWAPRLKACREFAEAANKAGGKVELVVLPEIGIKGNSHMLMQDRNSLEIADWLLAWIDRTIERK
jgi:pimeloyl-ACP methyl ester carboxylesterase